MGIFNVRLLVLAEQITLLESHPKFERVMIILVSLAGGMVAGIAILAGK